MSAMIREKWAAILKTKERAIEDAVSGAFENALQSGYGFVIVKRDRSGSYFASNARWTELDEVLRKLGARGPLGGRDD